MSWLRALTLSLLFALPTLASAGDLTTRDVVELHREGLGEELLVALIEVDGGPFDLSTADVLDLKAEGLPDAVIAALIRVGRARQHDVNGPAYLDESEAEHPAAEPDTWVTYDTRQTEVVAVPVPIYVPVPHPHRRRPHQDRDLQREQPPGVRRGRVSTTLGTAPGIVRSAPTTVDDIRHAPPGFHPGQVGPRADDRDASASSRPRGTASETTPGVARSADRADERASTPGVARSRRQ